MPVTALDETPPALTQELWAALGQPGESRPFSAAELTCLLPGKIDTPERTYCARMIWAEGIYEITYDSLSIKGDRPEPYVHKWKIIFPRPVQQPTEVLCKARMLLYLLREGYIAPADVLARARALQLLPASDRAALPPVPAAADRPPAAAPLTGATVMPPFHTELAAGRWFTLTYAEQLGNLGSEVERTIRAIETDNPERKARAFARALELLDLTIKDPRRTGKQEELRRLRETLCDVFQGENAAGTTFESLRRYFLEWGLIARADR